MLNTMIIIEINIFIKAFFLHNKMGTDMFDMVQVLVLMDLTTWMDFYGANL